MKEFLPYFENINLPVSFKLKSCCRVLEALNEFIGRKVIVLTTKNDNNLIIHPYSYLLSNDNMYLLAYNELSKKLEHINLESIDEEKIVPLKTSFRKILDNEKIWKRSLIGKSIANNNSGMKEYWTNFSYETGYLVGSRAQWYNEVSSIVFKRNIKGKLKSYIEVCCQYGYKKQLIINLLVTNIGEEVDEFDDISKVYENILVKENLYKEELVSEGNNRLKIELFSKPITEVENIKFDVDVQDPKSTPMRPEHFLWFKSRLTKIENIFKNEIRKS